MKYFLFVLLMFNTVLSIAMQAGDPGLPGEDPDLPVDGGITFLLIAGAVYGIRKINQQRNR
jgi:hypothetical protein